ncbi:MAG: GNAT family N-acetyltransferase [Promethearchaeota archaeon]
MPSKLDDLYKLQKTDIKKAGEILADAFKEDPIWKKFIRVNNIEAQKIQYLFGIPILFGLKYGKAYASSSNLEAIAAWFPDSTPDITIWRAIRSGVFKYGLKLGLKITIKMAKTFRPIEKDRKEHMKNTSYIYITILGVKQEYQKQGFGGKILQAIFEESDMTRTPILPETSTSQNVEMYENYGFKVLKEIILPELDLPMWEMKRDPMN